MAHTTPKAVFPGLSAEQQLVCQGWQAQITHAANTGGRICIRGGGSKAFHPRAQQSGITSSGLVSTTNTIDTLALRGVLAYEPSELVITALAGTPVTELQTLLTAQGQYLPFDPPHFVNHGSSNAASVGGMVATGLSGPARANVGGMRDYVLGANLINGLGQALCFGGTVIKNVAGYDVSRLLVGSWGSLGVITQVSLKVLPRAPACATLCFDWEQEQALAQLTAWRSLPLPINASYWVSNAGQIRLYVRLTGARSAVQAACAAMGGVVLEQAQADSHWQALREQTLPFFTEAAHDCALWRLSLPANTPMLPLARLGLTTPLLEWHGALRWVFAPLAQGEVLQKLAQVHGGWASVFRWPESVNLQSNTKPALTPVFSGISGHTDLERRVRLAFDPQQVFALATTI